MKDKNFPQSKDLSPEERSDIQDSGIKDLYFSTSGAVPHTIDDIKDCYRCGNTSLKIFSDGKWCKECGVLSYISSWGSLTRYIPNWILIDDDKNV